MSFIKATQPESFKEHAYKQIKQAIIKHDVEPGAFLYERDLSEDLGISRTPLKLALNQLEIEGWIRSLPRKGIKVNEITKSDVREVFELRKANETLAIELLIPKLDQQSLEKIENMYDQQSYLKDDDAAFVTYDTEFHLYLAELSQNQRLYQIIKSLTDQFNWFGVAALKSETRLDQSFHEHALIIEGLKAGDVSKTKKAVEKHIENTYEAVINNLKPST